MRTVHLVTARGTGTQWMQAQLEAWGFEVEVTHVGWHQIVPTPRCVTNGAPCVVMLRHPVLHAITQTNRDEPDALHAFPYLREWARAFSNVHMFDLDTKDRASEERALVAFLAAQTGITAFDYMQWAPVNETADKYGLKAQYEETGMVPACIAEVMSRTGDTYFFDGGVTYKLPPTERPNVWLFTPMHTGTQFTRHLLGPQLGCQVHQRHIPDPPDMFSLKYVEEGKTSVVTLYDPVMCGISWKNRDNQLPPDWEKAFEIPLENGWHERDNVHFFQVDSDTTRRKEQIVALCDHVGLEVPMRVEWQPRNVRADIHGLKRPYLTGNPTDDVREMMDLFASNEALVEFYAAQGCSYPWMN